MSLIDDADLSGYRALAASEIERYQGLMFRHTGVFTLGRSEWSCRFSARDPRRELSNQSELARLQALASVRDLAFTDLRVLKLHPDDVPPYPGATIPWDDGTLELLEWSQQSDFTDMRVGTCVLRRP